MLNFLKKIFGGNGNTPETHPDTQQQANDTAKKCGIDFEMISKKRVRLS